MMRRGIYWWVVVLASSLTTGAIAVIISLHSQAESERKLCAFFAAQDDAYTAEPPSTPTGQRIAAALRDLRGDLDCPKS